MHKEIKISLPLYKIAYAVFFVVILSLVRGVTYTYEIGIALEAPMAILAAVFCADTYAQEIVSKRSEVQRLYPMGKRISSIFKRMIIQGAFLFLLAVIGYGLFFVFQDPFTFLAGQGSMDSEAGQFFIYLGAMAVTLSFWSILSNISACFLRNMWTGIGGCLVLWLITNSSIGDRYFRSWNLFSYTFRNITDSGSFSWVWGKIVCICLSIILMAALPNILKKRG